ncbi:MAG: putative PurR-regulated permease PerM [Oceanicoccus sp.]|jgi:predicted PurR-regulated permease PerM
MSPAKKKVRKVRSSRKKEVNLNLVLPHFARYFFVIAILGVGGLFLWVVSPFFDTLIFALLVSVVFYPVRTWLSSKLGDHRNIVAFISTLFVMLLLLVPLVLLSIFLVQEAVSSYVIIEHKLNTVDIQSIYGLADLPWVGQWLSDFSNRYGLNQFVQDYELDLVSILKNTAESVTGFIVGSAGAFFKGFSDGVAQMFIFLMTVFYFFKDGDILKEYAKKISPLPSKYENEIESKLKESTYGVVVGNFGTALIQGLAGGIGFAIVGVENVFLWGTMMAFASLIPYVGATVIWLPIAASIAITGEYWLAGFLVVWGLMVVSSVDNIVRPFLIGGQTKMHSLATFLVVIGGILIFGLKGIIYGPIILTLTITLVHIYEKEYEEMLSL